MGSLSLQGEGWGEGIPLGKGRAEGSPRERARVRAGRGPRLTRTLFLFHSLSPWERVRVRAWQRAKRISSNTASVSHNTS